MRRVQRLTKHLKSQGPPCLVLPTVIRSLKGRIRRGTCPGSPTQDLQSRDLTHRRPE